MAAHAGPSASVWLVHTLAIVSVASASSSGLSFDLEPQTRMDRQRDSRLQWVVDRSGGSIDRAMMIDGASITETQSTHTSPHSDQGPSPHPPWKPNFQPMGLMQTGGQEASPMWFNGKLYFAQSTMGVFPPNNRSNVRLFQRRTLPLSTSPVISVVDIFSVRLSM